MKKKVGLKEKAKKTGNQTNIDKKPISRNVIENIKRERFGRNANTANA